MRKIALFAAFMIFFSQLAFAQTDSPTPTKSASSSATVDSTIQALKDKIATKVAELRKDNDKIITGTIDKIDGNTIYVTGSDSKKYSITYDDTITEIFSVSLGLKQLTFADLAKGDYLILSGPIIDNTITANTIYRDDHYLVTSGKVTDLDTTNGTIRILTSEKDDLTLNVKPKTTKLLLFDIKSFALNTSTIDKVKEGDTIHFVAKQSLFSKETTLDADSIVVIPQEYFAQ